MLWRSAYMVEPYSPGDDLSSPHGYRQWRVVISCVTKRAAQLVNGGGAIVQRKDTGAGRASF
jgi:hypothetical protein